MMISKHVSIQVHDVEPVLPEISFTLKLRFRNSWKQNNIRVVIASIDIEYKNKHVYNKMCCNLAYESSKDHKTSPK